MRRILPLLAAAFMLPGCASDRPAGDLTAQSVVPYFADRSARLPGGTERTLGRIPLPHVRGTDGPTAIGTADGRVVYPTFDEKVRLDPLRTARSQGITERTVLGRGSVRISGPDGDRPLADGAFAPAVSLTGRVAVGLLDDPDERYGQRYNAAIAVLEPHSTSPTRWTPSGGVRTPVAWLGDSLLYALPGEVGLPELRITTGPGTDRRLAERGALVAAAPDGRRVLVAVEEPGGGERLTLEVLSIADGQPLARSVPGLRWTGLGSWSAGGIVVVGAPRPGTLTALELDTDLRERRRTDFAVPSQLASPPAEVAVAPDHRAFGVVTFVAGTREPDVSWVMLGCSLDTGLCHRDDLRPGLRNLGFVSNPSV
jgi:hypothetical protein